MPTDTLDQRDVDLIEKAANRTKTLDVFERERLQGVICRWLLAEHVDRVVDDRRQRDLAIAAFR
jgi:hypothetical protein